MLHPLVTCALVANVGAFAYTTVSGLSFDSIAKAYLSKVRASACLVISLPKTGSGILIVPHKASQNPMDDKSTALVGILFCHCLCGEGPLCQRWGEEAAPRWCCLCNEVAVILCREKGTRARLPLGFP